MALDLAARYPGQVDTDAAYPQGKARNVVTEGDGTGTPLEKDLVNDHLGLFQGLLLAAGIAPNGTPDSATSSQYLLAFYRLIRRVDGWGAIGNDSADDTAALQAALNAVSAYGGHQELHLVPGKIYRHTGLTVPVNVDIYLHGATLAINHATNDHLTYAGTFSGADTAPRKIVGGTLDAVIANSGTVVKYAVTSGFLDVVDCQMGLSGLLAGKFVSFTGFLLAVERTLFYGTGNSSHVEFTGTILRMTECRHTIPATYSSDCVKFTASHAWISRCRHLLTAHNSGTMACYRIVSAGKVHLDDNEFENDNADGGTVNAIQWDVAAHILETGSQFLGKVVPYLPAAGVTLEVGSRLSLLEYKYTTYAGATCVLPVGVRNVVTRSTEASGVISCEFPVGLFPGQPLNHMLSTTYTGGITIPTIGGSVPVYYTDSVGLTTGVQNTTFIWMDPAGGTSYRWMQITPWHTVS